MSTVPTPQLVIIQTIDGDLQCPLDEVALAAFGESLADVLDQIVTASPDSQILIVGQWGRPDCCGRRGFRRSPSGSTARTHRHRRELQRLL